MGKTQETARTIWKHTKIQINSVPDTCSNHCQPGGVMTIVNDDMVGRIKQSGYDDMGRWMWTTIQRGYNRHITIINAYILCQQTHVTKVRTYHMQMYRYLVDNDINPVNIQRKCWEDIK